MAVVFIMTMASQNANPAWRLSTGLCLKLSDQSYIWVDSPIPGAQYLPGLALWVHTIDFRVVQYWGIARSRGTVLQRSLGCLGQLFQGVNF
jgi:hypothetical protein